ncbi:MAG: GGDEF domain-containing protein [Desulfarculus sp.]|nr:GGDEF domain-containing protein [Desulfarculus sp.]
MNLVPRKVLMAAGQPGGAAGLAELLSRSGGEAFEVCLATGREQFLALAGQEDVRVALWAGDGPGALPLVEELRRQAPSLPLVLVLEPWDPLAAGQALAVGAQDCLDGQTLDPARLALALDLASARLEALERERRRTVRYQSIVEHQTELICRFASDGTLTFTNQALASYVGQPAARLVGVNIYDHLPAADAEGTRRLLEQLTPQHPLGRIEQTYTTPGGERRWQRWTDWGIFDQEGRLVEVQAVGRDITERKRMEEALQVVESNLRQLIVDNADGLIVAGADGLVLFVNPAAERIMATRAWDLVGRPFAFPLATGQRHEMCLRAADGQKVVVEMRVVPTKWQGQPALLASLRDISELAQLREELRSLSLVDDLTGLYNRRGFLTLARQQVKTAQRMGRRLHLFFIDVDDLKLINDRLGHTEGDRALVAASQVLKSTFRGSDIVARMGGDEFVALALEGEEETTEPISQRLEHNLRAWRRQGLHPFPLSLSLGTTVYDPAAPRPLEDLLKEADQRMYEHKRGKPLPHPGNASS